MEIDEVAARVMRGYWALLLVMTVLPSALVGFWMQGKEPPAVAETRLQASGRATDAAAGDAGVSIVVSQVKAFATSRNLLVEVLDATGADRSPQKVVKAIGVTGLGTSTVVELTVKDRDPAVATKLADTIGAAVVKEINESNQGTITRQIDTLDKRIRELEKRLGPLARRAGAQPFPDIGAANERERVQAELTDLRSNRSDLRTQLSAAGTASVVQPAVLRPEQNPMIMMTAIAGLIGLVGGILIAVVAEMVRPTVPGQRRVADRLGVPLLGRADGSPAELADLGRRIRLAAKREGRARVTLVGAPGRLPPDLVSKIAAAVYGDTAKVVRTDVRISDGGPGGAPQEETAPSSNSSGPDGTKSTSVVRTGGAAVATQQAAEVATAAETASESTQPVPFRALCHVHAFEDIDPGADDAVGVIVVAGPLTPVSGLASVRDLVAASGWPLLGVIATSQKSATSHRKQG